MRGDRFFPTAVQMHLHRKALRAFSVRGKRGRSLDLGSGPLPANPFQARECWGVDIWAYQGGTVRQADLAVAPIPFESCNFDFVSAKDFLEHVPRVSLSEGQTRFPFVNLMNEVYRVLKPGGFFYSFTPSFPSPAAFQDPTHVNFITSRTMIDYFCERRWAAMYGFNGVFRLLASGWVASHHYSVLMRLEQS